MSDRLSMKKIREVLRLKYECGLPHRQVAASCGIGISTVSDYLHRAERCGMSWADAKPLTDAQVEARLGPISENRCVSISAAFREGPWNRLLEANGFRIATPRFFAIVSSLCTRRAQQDAATRGLA
jgi:hypothetical protein